MSAEREVADFVMDHLSRGKPLDMALGSITAGLADIGNALMDAQEARGNWGAMIANLRVGSERVGVALEPLRKAGPQYAGLVEFAERQQRFALLLVDEIVRLQAQESTPV
jgi:hypothetical protein